MQFLFFQFKTNWAHNIYCCELDGSELQLTQTVDAMTDRPSPWKVHYSPNKSDFTPSARSTPSPQHLSYSLWFQLWVWSQINIKIRYFYVHKSQEWQVGDEEITREEARMRNTWERCIEWKREGEQWRNEWNQWAKDEAAVIIVFCFEVSYMSFPCEPLYVYASNSRFLLSVWWKHTLKQLPKLIFSSDIPTFSLTLHIPDLVSFWIFWLTAKREWEKYTRKSLKQSVKKNIINFIYTKKVLKTPCRQKWKQGPYEGKIRQDVVTTLGKPLVGAADNDCWLSWEDWKSRWYKKPPKAVSFADIYGKSSFASSQPIFSRLILIMASESLLTLPALNLLCVHVSVFRFWL